MKTIVAQSIASVVLIVLLAMPTIATELTVTVTGLTEVKSKIIVRVYDNKDSWLSENKNDILAEKHVSAAENAELVSVIFELEEGLYAFTAFQDVYDDGRLNKSWIGIPREPVTDSSNKKNKKGPPSFQSAIVEVKGGKQRLELKLIEY